MFLKRTRINATDYFDVVALPAYYWRSTFKQGWTVGVDVAGGLLLLTWKTMTIGTQQHQQSRQEDVGLSTGIL